MNPQQQAALQVVNSPMPNQAQPSQPHGPNGFEKLLPTIGGIAGGVLGDILPGGPLTGIAGAAGGDALGKFIENKMTGQAGGNSVLESAIEGGAGQGVGGLVARGAQGVLGLGGNVLSHVAANREGALADEALNKGLTGLSNKDLVQGGVGQGKKLIQGMGVTPTPENMANIPHAVGDAFNSHIDNVLKTTGPVDLTAVGRQVAKLDTATQNILTPNLSDETTAFSANANAPDARKLLGAIQEAQAGAKPVVQSVGQKIDPMAQQQYKNLTEVVNTLKSAIYKRPGVDEAFAAAKGSVTPEQVLASSPNLSPEEAMAAADYANGVLSNAKTGQDVLTPYSKLINLGKAGDKAVAFNNDVLPIRPTATENPELIGKGGQSLLGSAHPALEAGAKVVNAAAEKVPLKGLSEVMGKAAASKIIPSLVKSGSIASANLPNDVGSAIPTLPMQVGQSNMGGTMPPTQDPTQAYYQTLLNQLQAQPADAQTGSILSALSGAVPAVQKQSLAAPVISSLLGSYQNAGGAQGPVAGGLSQATSVIPGSAASTYQGQQESAAATLASLLGITPAAAMSLLPGLMQNQATASTQQSALHGILGGIGGTPSAIPIGAQ